MVGLRLRYIRFQEEFPLTGLFWGFLDQVTLQFSVMVLVLLVFS